MQSSNIYAEAVALKLERLHSEFNQPFFISSKICAAINSILYVQQSIQPLAEAFGFYQLRDAPLWNNNGCSHQGDQSLQETLTKNAIKEMEGKLDVIFITVARKVIYKQILLEHMFSNKLWIIPVWRRGGQINQKCDGN